MKRYPAFSVALLALATLAWLPVSGQETEAAAPVREPETPAPVAEPADPGAAFAPLDLPDPNDVRAANGAPGPAYWQQRVDYVIRATLDNDRITGTETVTYVNHSPDDLTSLWLQLDQNLFKPDSYGAARYGEGGRFGGFFKDAGFDLTAVTVRYVEGEAARGGEAFVPEYRVEDTMMEVLLPEPLSAEGGTLQLTIDFSFEIPETGADRMGRLKMKRGTIYQLAQWYPRLFTYDDVRGWNHSPFLGQGEWYLEFGDFDVEITVPREMIVVATGELRNPEEVLTPAQLRRLAEARTSAETLPIVGRDEVGKKESRPEGEAPLTWSFRAERVRDFAFAASKAFVWDAAGWNDVLIMSVYPEESIGVEGFSGWERSTEYLRHSVRYYSEQWYPYPYPVAINVAGLALGMEYPMIVFCAYQARGGFLFAVTDHEIGHTWFPMIVGSDERNYPWMDEGFDTFMNWYSGIAFTEGQPILADAMTPAAIAKAMRGEDLLPMITPADSLSEEALGLLAYNKPGAMLLLLRETVLGPDIFDEAFRAYIDRWAYKHPQPADFIRTMEDVSGEDLDWFFRGWIYTTATLDQAVADVKRNCPAPASDCVTEVTIENRGELVMPLEVRFVYRDGTEETYAFPVDIWRESDVYVATVEKPVKQVQIDPDRKLPDVSRANNVFGRGVVGRRSGGG